MQTSNQSIPDVPVEKVAIYVDAGGAAHADNLRGLAERALAPLNLQPIFVDTPDQAEQAEPVLVLQTAPAEALALAIAAGIPALQALADWRQRTEALLAFFRKNRRRALIVEDAAFLADIPKALRRMGLTIAEDVSVEAGEGVPPADDLARVLGAELLRRDAVATAIAGELEASAALIDPERSPADIEAAFTRYDQAVRECVRLTGMQDEASARIAGLEAGLAEGQHEQGAVLQQLFDSQAKWHEERQAREKAQLERERLNRTLEDVQSMAARLKADLAKKGEAEAKLGEDKRLLEARILQLGQGMESSDAQLKAEKAARAEAERERQALAARIEELIERARRLEASEAERRTLAKVRKTLEAELKTRFTELGTITAQLVERNRTMQSHVEELAASRAEIDASQSEMVMLRGTLESLNEEQRLHADILAASRAELDASYGEIEALKARLAALDDERRLDGENLAASRMELDSSRDEIVGLKSRLETLEEERRADAEFIAAGQAELEGSKGEIADLKSRVEALDSEHRLQVERLEQDLAERTSLHEQGAVEREGLHQTLETRFTELGALTARLMEREEALDERTSELAAIRDNLAWQIDEAVNLRQQLTDREAELNMVYASPSYRMGAPMRWLRNALAPRK